MFSSSGIDVMVPMANASFGGIVFAILTTFVVPIIYAAVHEKKLMH
jgi:Cu(I)/Ag(I) efflux system membrane protein CusA/SilA